MKVLKRCAPVFAASCAIAVFACSVADADWDELPPAPPLPPEAAPTSGAFTHTPPSDCEGFDRFTYTMDDQGFQADATVRIGVGTSIITKPR